MTFSDSAVTDVVVDTSGETASFGAAAADELREQLLAAGSAEIDGVSGSTITSDAVMKAAKSCYAQAKGEAVVSSVQLPTGDENDWLGKEPDIDEAAITETVDTDILIVGAGNGGMFAAAYAAANGLNFRVIEQNANVQDTRHWYGAVDSAAAKEAGEPATDKAKLLSEISRYAPASATSALSKPGSTNLLPCTTLCAAFWKISTAGCAISPPAARLHGPQRMPSTTPTTSTLCRSTTTWPARAHPVCPATSCCCSTFRSWATM